MLKDCPHGTVGYCEQCALRDPGELGEAPPKLVGPIQKAICPECDKLWARPEERATIAAKSDRIDALEEVLHELVSLKNMHDEIERIKPMDLSGPRNYHAEALEEDYKNRKPKAWQSARELLAGTNMAALSPQKTP